MITRNNYELYIIDFYDGKLNKIQTEELRAFLDQHPDLKEEFELLSHATLEPETMVFADKNSLKKTDSKESELLIAYFENDLNPVERKNVEQNLKSNPAMAQELEIIKKTRLLPDYTILFSDKSSLRKTAKVISFSSSFYRNLSIAASVILIAIAYFIFRPHQEEKMMVDKNNKETLPVETPIENKAIAPAPMANNPVDKGEKQRKVLPLKERNVAPSSNLAQEQKTIKNESPEQNTIQQSALPENNLAVQQKMENFIPVIEQQPIANNASQSEKSEVKVGQVADLSEIFSQAELAELGLARNVKVESKKSESILNVAADKLKRFSDTKEIGVVKKENYIDDATTYAVNVGEKFSVSHTRRR